MGVIINSKYHADDPGPDSVQGGEFKRAASTIRDWITTEGPYTPDPGRYHLYVAWNCPWAHRSLLAREILGLQGIISVSYARPRRTGQGWAYDTEGEYSDAELGVHALHEVFARQRPAYTGRLTVPVLWDREAKQIVSNESAEIIRMFALFGRGPELYPEPLRPEIDAWNNRIYATLNNGVYRAGFARTQEAYGQAVQEVFATLDAIEARLASPTGWWVISSPRPTSGYSRHSPGSMWPTTTRSNATCAGSWIIPHFGNTRGGFTQCPAWRERFGSTCINRGISLHQNFAILWASCLWGR